MEPYQVVGLLANLASFTILLPSIYEQVKYKLPGRFHPHTIAQVIIVNMLWVVYGTMTADVYVGGRAFIAGLISVLTLLLYFKYSKVQKAGNIGALVV
jgi:uncharacterized protein with PQ loop repeat